MTEACFDKLDGHEELHEGLSLFRCCLRLDGGLAAGAGKEIRAWEV
jgi:hypothetical protein